MNSTDIPAEVELISLRQRNEILEDRLDTAVMQANDLGQQLMYYKRVAEAHIALEEHSQTHATTEDYCGRECDAVFKEVQDATDALKKFLSA